ncbi:ubiquinone biosynthesis hydrox [Rhizoclosmatium globosum]|uniref:Ubiquinone biosynthesis hydrox n=1 Tax=Rhizoclosmatium globosum TaxID=329046 RepID=A0A1Y2CBH7_9FUNG|nr:ubiquinone biosynthesis hydrox [Rhizoclosmatium globosum]|eukprot:ORY44389.1 ubiquinone biosynthesis hydrox [Rhizoclosmatium globosum]
MGALARTDICIVGGGIVGTALAAALSTSAFASHLKVTLIEGGDLFALPDERTNYFSNRVSSVTPESAKLLKRIGAWDRIPEDRKKPFAQMKVWDALGNGKLAFNAPQTHAASCMGWIVENSWLRKSLTESLGSSVSVLNKSFVEDISSGEGSGLEWPILTLKDKSKIQARLLIGADGANSLVRKYANIKSSGWDYPQKAIVATLKVENVEGNNNDVAYQRFLPGGPIACLPLSANRSSLVWSTHPATAAKLSKLSTKDFASFVDIAFRNPVEDLKYLTGLIQEDGSLPSTVNLEEEAAWGRQRLVEANMNQIGAPPAHTTMPKISGVIETSRAGFPLRFYLSERYVSDKRAALIGDAAHTIHPLAGQGLNLGLLDVGTIAKVIEEGLQSGSDIGNIHTLQNYASERFAPNLGMMLAVDSIGKLFRAESDPIVWARSFGLNMGIPFQDSRTWP